VRRWAFKSPRPWDFFRTMEDVSGEELGWFFRGWFYENGVLDQAVVEVVQGGEGDDDGVGEEAVVAVFENRGQLVMPLRYRVKYADGTEEVRAVPGGGGAWRESARVTERWETPRGRRVVEVVVDPEEEMPDVELRNNGWER
jgi:hypothetical protein